MAVPHPKYKPIASEDDYDVGLVRLPEALIFTDFRRAIPLARLDPEYLNLDMKNVTISGWGKTSDSGSVSNVLKYTTLRVIPSAECTSIYGDIRMDQKICCSTADGHSTCNGDSGGPLILKGLDGVEHEVGIVSYGSDTCTHENPVVFDRVTSYLDFIDANTGVPEGQPVGP